MYNKHCKAFRDSQINTHEFYNDLIVLLFGYMCMGISDW
jgi:hypothetical protein